MKPACVSRNSGWPDCPAAGRYYFNSLKYRTKRGTVEPRCSHLRSHIFFTTPAKGYPILHNQTNSLIPRLFFPKGYNSLIAILLVSADYYFIGCGVSLADVEEGIQETIRLGLFPTELLTIHTKSSLDQPTSFRESSQAIGITVDPLGTAPAFWGQTIWNLFGTISAVW